jgi:hypothetical protein
MKYHFINVKTNSKEKQALLNNFNAAFIINPLTPELNASCSGCLPEFFPGFFNFNACS